MEELKEDRREDVRDGENEGDGRRREKERGERDFIEVRERVLRRNLLNFYYLLGLKLLKVRVNQHNILSQILYDYGGR